MFRRRSRRGRAALPVAHPDHVAFLGPVPPTPTGIATYDRAVLDGLERIGFTREMPVDVVWPVHEDMAAAIHGYATGVYQLGNNVEFHLEAYRMAWEAPGLVVLHDLALDDFLRGLQTEGDPLGYVAVREALAARERLESFAEPLDEPLRLPSAAAIARRSRGVVVHADFCRRYLEALGCRTPIYVVPHPVAEDPRAVEGAAGVGRALRARADARGARTLVVAAGDLNEAKQLGAVVGGVEQLPADVHLVLVGRRVPTFDVTPVVERSALGDRLHVAHDVADDEFLGWLHAADVVVDLRYPHRGEVSGSLARAMQVGRPTIVSATGTYLDAPHGTVVHVAGGPADPDEVAAAIASLAGDPPLRERMGAAARAHMAELGRTDGTARAYAAAIHATARIVADPVAEVMTRWAHALVDVGIGPAELREGHGLRYARALESFKRSP